MVNTFHAEEGIWGGRIEGIRPAMDNLNMSMNYDEHELYNQNTLSTPLIVATAQKNRYQKPRLPENNFIVDSAPKSLTNFISADSTFSVIEESNANKNSAFSFHEGFSRTPGPKLSHTAIERDLWPETYHKLGVTPDSPFHPFSDRLKRLITDSEIKSYQQNAISNSPDVTGMVSQLLTSFSPTPEKAGKLPFHDDDDDVPVNYASSLVNDLLERNTKSLSLGSRTTALNLQELNSRSDPISSSIVWNSNYTKNDENPVQPVNWELQNQLVERSLPSEPFPRLVSSNVDLFGETIPNRFVPSNLATAAANSTHNLLSKSNLMAGGLDEAPPKDLLYKVDIISDLSAGAIPFSASSVSHGHVSNQFNPFSSSTDEPKFLPKHSQDRPLPNPRPKIRSRKDPISSSHDSESSMSSIKYSGLNQLSSSINNISSELRNSNESFKLSMKQDLNETPKAKQEFKAFSIEFKNLCKLSTSEAERYARKKVEDISVEVRWRVYVELAELAKKNDDSDKVRTYLLRRTLKGD